MAHVANGQRMNPARITLRLTATGPELVVEFEPEPIVTTGEEVTETRVVALPGLRKCQPVAVVAKRAGGSR